MMDGRSDKIPEKVQAHLTPRWFTIARMERQIRRDFFFELVEFPEFLDEDSPDLVYVKVVFLGNARLRVGRDRAWIPTLRRNYALALRLQIIQTFPPLRICAERVRIYFERRYTDLSRLDLQPGAEIAVIVAPPPSGRYRVPSPSFDRDS
ncbi:hypothetical protein Aduo_017697 [Ancylostoma duodenale]